MASGSVSSGTLSLIIVLLWIAKANTCRTWSTRCVNRFRGLTATLYLTLMHQAFVSRSLLSRRNGILLLRARSRCVPDQAPHAPRSAGKRLTRPRRAEDPGGNGAWLFASSTFKSFLCCSGFRVMKVLSWLAAARA
ncbi:hypothetical protein BD414DRAFT_168341 [Trametes punicea]|nr:hypothetical protein BD414DRAFT_168341 [Trametes punicea]